jgi:hypothetical protein
MSVGASTLVNTGGTIDFSGGSFTPGALTVAGGRINVAAASHRMLRVPSLAVTAAGAVDLNDNAMIVDYSGASPLASIQGYLTSGYAAGSWNGVGIRSSVASMTANRALGYGEASAIFTSFPAVFQGQSVDSTSVLVLYTRYGDATLDGLVNLSDFNRLASNFGQSGRVWTQGDFTYDGIVNLADFNRLASNFGLSASLDGPSPQDWASLASAVPEPSGIPFMLLLCARIRRWTRRRGARYSMLH